MTYSEKDYTELNSKTIDRWIDEGWEWGIPVSHETYKKALDGDWSVLLTPTKPVPREWFGELRGKKLLGLASGGGQQIPLLPPREQNAQSSTTPKSSSRAKDLWRSAKDMT